jgi:hypothetical protein
MYAAVQSERHADAPVRGELLAPGTCIKMPLPASILGHQYAGKKAAHQS